ncbi:MAG TPA: hypothetical protein VF144_13245 [Chitinophagaceae bacterium]
MVVRRRWILRCDDGINYRPGKCHESGVTTVQVYQIFGVANLAGCTIVIPHISRAASYWKGNNE